MPLVMLDTGNWSDTPTEAGDLRTHALLTSMAALGYKAAGIGDHDVANGYDEFKKRTAGIAIPFVSTNIVKQGTFEPVFPPSTIVEVAGGDGRPIRIGVMAVNRYNPVWEKPGPGGTTMAIAPPLQMIKPVLGPLRAKSDIVVLLASLAKDDCHELARQLPDVDMIFASYGGIFNTSEEMEGRTRIYYAGNQGKRLGESRIGLDAKRRPATIVTYMHFLSAQVPEDKAMKEALAPVIAKAAAPDAQPAQQPPPPLKKQPADAAAVTQGGHRP